MTRIFLVLLLVFLTSLGKVFAAELWQGRVLHACEVEEGYPPFAFPGPDGRAQGYAVTLLTEALEATGLRLDVAFLPANRCAALVDDGEMDLLMEDDWRPDRIAVWMPSAAIYQGPEVLYYDRERHPDGLDLAELRAHPQAYPGCAILGYTYDGEDFPAGQLAFTTAHYAQALDMLMAGRCTFFPELLLFGAAYRYHGLRLTENPRIGHIPLTRRPIPGSPEKSESGAQESLYVHLRRSFPDGRAVMTRIDETIARWAGTGRGAEVMATFTGSGDAEDLK